MSPKHEVQKRLVILLSIVAYSTCLGVVELNLTTVVGTKLADVDRGCRDPMLASHNNLSSYLEVNQSGSVSWIELAKTLSVDLLETTKCAKAPSTPYDIEYNCSNIVQKTSITVILSASKDPSPFFCNSSCYPISQLDLQVSKSCNSEYRECLLNNSAFRICALNGSFEQPTYTISKNTFDVKYGDVNIIKLVKNIDFDTVPQYDFNVTLNGSQPQAVLKVHVRVIDEDDLGVTFEKITYECSIPENYNRSSNCSVKATDMDREIDAIILYKIISVHPSVDSRNFTIHENGTIGILPLDREKQSTYMLSVMAYQKDRENDRINFTTVFINVTDEDDNPPVMTSSHIFVELQENAPSGQFVAQVFAMDKDEGKNAEFSFLSVENNTSNFTINSTTGIVSVGQNPPDREALGTMTLKVLVRSEDKSKQSNETTINISILDVNDNSPNFTGKRNFTIEKTFQINATITQLNVTDADDGDNGNVSVSMEDTSPFNVSADGRLYLVRYLTETFHKMYVLTVTATDMAQPPSSRRSTSIELTVHVTDVNIHTPVLTITRYLNISEDSPIGTEVAVFTATDADPDDLLTYHLGTDSHPFKIVNNTIMTISTVDREVKSNYSITLVCNDTLHYTNQSFTINILDVNDNVPQFTNAPYNFSIEENNSSASIGIINASDGDERDNKRLSYWIDPHSIWAKNITIDNATGELKTIGSLDREVAALLSFMVFIQDHGQPSLMNETVVTVHVLDVNDNPPVFVSQSLIVNISENTKVAYITQVEATDADTGENGSIEYSINPKSSTGMNLNINQTTGVISMQTPPKINVLCQQSRHLTVKATDKGIPQQQTSLVITVNIIDVNDNFPIFPSDLELDPVREPGAPDKPFFWANNSKIKDQLARDDDCDVAFKTLHYWMDNTDVRFQINSSNGFISLRPNKTLDYDPPVNDRIIQFIIFATDGTHLSNTTVSLTVLNAIDFQPVFTKDVYECYVNETYRETACTVELIYLEPNDTIANEFMFQVNDSQSVNFTEGGLSPKLEILKPFDFEKQHELAVSVTVNNQMLPNIRKSNCTVIIRVLDVNDEPPVFHMTSDEYSFKEGNPANLTIGFVSVTDQDSPFHLTLACNPSNQFFDVRANGDVFTTHTFDYETDAHNFTCRITANDTVQTANKTVTIAVENINDNYPQFGVSENSTSINKTHAVGDNILQINASDADFGDTITFKIVGGDKIGLVINATTGVLSSSRNFSGPVEMNIVVEACDNGHPQLCNVTDVLIQVLNVNNHPPVFNKEQPVVQIYENTRGLVAQLNATDLDGDNLTYTICNNTSGFYMNGSSLYANYTDAEKYTATNGSCVLLVNVSDGQHTDQTKINIAILDENEFVPQFNNETFDAEINETLDVNSSMFTITATDNDLSNTGFFYVLYNSEGIFKINGSTGEVTLAKPVSHKVGEYNMTVVVHDNGHPSMSNSTTVTIRVRDVNESPTVKLQPSGVYLSANSPNGTVVAKINASDPDSDEMLSFSISVNSTADSMFVLHNSTIYTIYNNSQSLSSGNHSLNVTVIDGKGLSGSDVMFVVVYPTINYTNHTSVMENNKTNVNLSEISPGLELHFVIEPSTEMGKFSIINKTLVMTDSFDREETENVSLVIHGLEVHDILVSIITINIAVNDTNDCAPELDKRYEFSINDDTENNTVVTQIIARDRDVLPENRNISYILLGNGHDAFHVSSNGSLSVTSLQLYDFNEYNLTLVASDGVHNDTTAALHITIIDANDHSPVFTSNCSGPFKIAEDAKSGAYVGEVCTSDRDRGVNEEVTYAIEGSNENETFIIETNNRTGIIKTNNSLDRETRSSYVLTVVATDHALINPRTAVYSVVITVLDINDNSPTFLNRAGYKGTIAENSSNSAIVDMHEEMFVTDPDEGLNGTIGLVYDIVGNDLFLINPANGTISLNGTLDWEKMANITLTVTAADSNKTGNYSRTANTTVVIEVKDVNDNPPVFAQDHYAFNVTENVNSSEVVGVVNASDIDGPGNNNVRYRIISGDLGRFYIDGLRGILYVAGNIDRELNSSFSLNISASDGTYTDFTSVTIDVNDLNDNAPHFLNVVPVERIHIKVNESSTPPGVVYQVCATDSDATTTCNSLVQYELVNNTDEFIVINETTGEININSSLDREKQDTYTLYVNASDCGSPALSSILIIDIQVLDINDNYPVFYDSAGQNITSISSHIIEESPVESVIALLNATDADAKKNGLITYTLEQSSVSDLFHIQNSLVKLREPIIINNLHHKGIIHTNDTKNVVLNLTIIASDSGIPNLNASISLFVYVEPINDNAPVFSDCQSNCVVSENIKDSVLVGQCVASIRNESISHMQYKLMNDFNNSFAIDDFGNITTKCSLDRETQNVYLLTVRVTDGRIPERTAFAIVEVNVQDVNDNEPQFYQTESELTVPEDTFISRNISVNAFDKDFGINAELSYYLEDNNDTRFSVDSSSGMLLLNGTFDYEEQTEHNITVVVHDGGNPPFNNTKTMVLHILDVNDNNPIFDYQTANYSLKEDIAIGSKFISVNASDNDSGWNGKVVYRILDDDGGPFSINYMTGEIQTDGPLDYEQRHIYTLTVQASDLGTPALTANMSLTVYVLDVYDVIPRFDKPLYEVTVNSTSDNGTLLVAVNSSGLGTHYSLKNDFDGLFQIDDDGVLSLAKDVSESSVYQSPFVLTALAVDQVNSSASCLVIVRIVKDNPVVLGSVITSSVLENTSLGGLVADVNTSAEFAGEHVRYSIMQVEPTDANGMFNITPGDGKVYFNRKLDREMHAQYVLTISVQHSVQPRMRRSVPDSMSVITLIVNILDFNDNMPDFVDLPITIEIPLDIGANQTVARVKAVDPDTNTDTEMNYALIDGDTDTFSICNVSGAIETRVPVAIRNSNIFHLTIIARNGPNENDTKMANVTIHVKPTEQVVVFTIKQNVSSVLKNKDSILGNMSSVLPDIEVKLQSVQPHVEKAYPPFNPNNTEAARSDMFIYGVNKTTKEILSKQQMISLMQSYITELNKKLGTLTRHDPSAITKSQLAIISFAIAIFFGALIAIVFAMIGWSRYDDEMSMRELLRQLHKHDHEHEDYELSTIGSRQASQLSSAIAAASAVNPAYAETLLSDSFSQLPKTKKKETVYETQEVTMEFRDEHLAVAPAQVAESARSVVDSGVGNTSVELDANLAQDGEGEGRGRPSNAMDLDGQAAGTSETDDYVVKKGDAYSPGQAGAEAEKTGPVMTSSPRAHRALQLQDTGFGIEIGQRLESSQAGKATTNDGSSVEIKRSESRKKRQSTSDKFVCFVDIGETATDDELETDEEESFEEQGNENENNASSHAISTTNIREAGGEQANTESLAQSASGQHSSQSSPGVADLGSADTVEDGAEHEFEMTAL